MKSESYFGTKMSIKAKSTLERTARKYDLSVSSLVKRYIALGMKHEEMNGLDGLGIECDSFIPAEPGKSAA